MADDFKTQAARQRLKVLAAAKQQVAANISRYEAENDLDSAQDEIQSFANLETEERNLIDSYQRYQQQNAPRQQRPLSDSEFLALSPEDILHEPQIIPPVQQHSASMTFIPIRY